MATIHIRQIQRWLAEGGQLDAEPSSNGMFLEIRFNEPGSDDAADDEMRNKVIAAQSPQGNVSIIFDDVGFLRSIDIS